jgi:ferredoxin-NADP reductase
MSYSTKLLEQDRLAGDVAIFRFEKPDGFEFKAGQWCFLHVPDAGYQDERGLRRPLSIASSPLEKDLLFATKLSSSAMKRTLAEMVPGAAALIEKPMGSFLLPAPVEPPLIFLAGGVGITPFRSMIRYAADAPTGHDITLFYSNRTPEETPFLDELLAIPAANPRIRTEITMTRPAEGSKWSGLTGRLNPDMIRNNCPTWQTARYFIVGPPAMTEAMKQTLNEMSIAPERVTLELFAGY